MSEPIESQPIDAERLYADKKLFTLAEANAALPLVRAIAQDMVDLSREVVERRERLMLLRQRRSSGASDLYSDELAQIEEDLDKDGERLQEFVDELQALGVEPKNALEGLVDFPCRIDGRIVYLCWKVGEAEILFWHDLEAGFAGRQPLVGSGRGAAD